MSLSLKNKNANIFRNQLLEIKEDWELRKKRKDVIWSNEICHYNLLLKKAGTDLSDPEIYHYTISDEYLNSSAKGNKFIYPDTPLFQIKNLLIHIEGNYKINMFPEVSFIQNKFLKDKYLLFLLDKKQNPAHEVLNAATLEFEDNLRKIADLPDSCIGKDLINRSISPTTGNLTLTNRTTKEQEGFYNMAKGTIDFIRGKPNHVKIILNRGELYRNLIIIDKLLFEFNNLIKKNESTTSITTSPDQSI